MEPGEKELSFLMKQASTSTDPVLLRLLACEESKFVRVRVASNIHTDAQTHTDLLHDKDHAVVLWALGNKKTTSAEYRELFLRMQRTGYCSLLHPELARSVHATLSDLQELSKCGEWAVDLAIVNNFRGRDAAQFLQLIRHLLPPEDKEDTDWTEIEQLAYFRTFGIRRKYKD